MTGGRGAKVPRLLQSVGVEYVEAGNTGRQVNLDSIKEDDPRVMNNPFYNIPGLGTWRFNLLLLDI